MSRQASKRAMIAPPERNLRRNRTILYVSVAIVVVVVIVAVAFASRVPKNASNAPIQSTIKVGDAAPDFSVATTNGPFNLKTTLAGGKPVLLEVFATWCPHCQRMATVVDGLFSKYGSNVAFVGVSGSPYGIDGSSPETQQDVIGFQQQFHVAYPIAFDPDLTVAHLYLQGGYPTFVLIDKTGKVTYINSGEIAQGDLAKALDKLST